MQSEHEPSRIQTSSSEQLPDTSIDGVDGHEETQITEVHEMRSIGGTTLNSLGVEAPYKTTIYEKFETDGYITAAPHFADILSDESRTNPVTYLASMNNTQGPYTEEHTDQSVTKTEHEVVNKLASFLAHASENLPDEKRRQKAANMLKTMTFIGEREHIEASQGIATYWKEYLSNSQDHSIVALTGTGPNRAIKSDSYMLDRVLSNFTDEDKARFEGRITINPDKITSDSEDTKVVLLDDWVIDGMQLGELYQNYLNKYPDHQESMEVQLLVASEERLNEELVNQGIGYASIHEAPIKAYYKTDFDNDDQAITGYHSSTDHNFDDAITQLIKGTDMEMPAGTNIVRPYRMPNARLDNIDRFS